MNITRVEYPFTTKKKFQVIYDNKEYTCYLDCFNGNYVCTGDGKSIDCKDITKTKLGMTIIAECFKK